jgi:hypothetical protein
MALSFAQYSGDGTNRNFSVPFPYIDRSHISVSVNGVSVPFSFLSQSVVQTATAPAPGTAVDVRRTTPSNTSLVDFVDASTLLESDLDLSALQTLYVSQETKDDVDNTIGLTLVGTYDAQSRRVVNVGAPTDPNDAARKADVDGLVAASSSAASSASAASSSAAASSAAAALVSENAAAASAVAANNVVTSGTVGAVRHDAVQSLTGGQQTQARTNIGAINQAFADARYLGDTYRNRIVNPAMQISQERGTALVDVTTGAAYTVDQWLAALSTTPGGTLRAQQVASATPGGSPFRLRFTAQAADASIAAGDIYTIVQYVEGQMIADARFGTASARQIVIRLGVRSSLAGTFGVRITNSAFNRTYVTTITIAGGEINTDLLRTVVIPGDTAGTWLTDTGVGLSLQITLASGTTFQGTAGSWQAGNFTTTSGQTNFMGTASATFELFDVGLYVSALAIGVAPSWELPAWDADLRACSRYYQVLTNQIIIEGYTTAATTIVGNVALPVPVRAFSPVLSFSNVSYSNASGILSNSVSSTTIRVQVTPTVTGAAFAVYDVAINARF